MQIVIDIPIDTHYHTKKRNVSESDIKIILEAISKGVSLPKGHGDLVDKNTLEGHYVCSINLDGACVLKCDCKDCSSGVYQLYDDIDNIPVIVKADEESEG